MAVVLDTMLDDASTRGPRQGQAEGKREALRTIIRTRFGLTLEQRISEAGANALEALIAGAAVAKGIEEL